MPTKEVITETIEEKDYDRCRGGERRFEEILTLLTMMQTPLDIPSLLLGMTIRECGGGGDGLATLVMALSAQQQQQQQQTGGATGTTPTPNSLQQIAPLLLLLGRGHGHEYERWRREVIKPGP